MTKPNTSPEIVTKRILAYLQTLGLSLTTEIESEVAARVTGHENAAVETKRKELTRQYLVYELNLDDVNADGGLDLSKTFMARALALTTIGETAKDYAHKQVKSNGLPLVIVNGAFELLDLVDEEPKKERGYSVSTTVGIVCNFLATTVEGVKAEDYHLVDATFFTKIHAVAAAKHYVRKLRTVSDKSWEESLIFVTADNEKQIIWGTRY